MPTPGTVVVYLDTLALPLAAVVLSDQGSSITLQAFAGGGTWNDGTVAGVLVRTFAGVTAGSGQGQYQTTGLSSATHLASASDIVSLTDSVNAIGSEIGDPDFGNEALLTKVQALPTSADVDTAIAAAITAVPAATTRVALPTAGSAPSLTIGTARNPSSVRGDSRATRVTVCGSWTVTATGSGSVELRSDSASTPTTVRCHLPVAATVVIGVGMTLPWLATYDVPAGDSYVIATSGSGTFAIGSVNETVM